MNHNSNFFERLIKFAQSEGIMNANQLAKHLGYGSSEKISRLGRDKSTKPGFDLLVDLANMFENVPLYWLITGNDPPVKHYIIPEESDIGYVNDPQEGYTRLPPKHGLDSETTVNNLEYGRFNAHFQELLDEKERVIATLQEVIDAQKDTIALLKENRSV